MNYKLWSAIQELLDTADGAAKVLDNYAGNEWDKWAYRMVPNSALVYQTELEACVARVEKLMPAAPDDLPDMGALIGKAHREETI
jgi:hypothetical protein